MTEKERRKIYDIAVNRVDGVTEPATGRSFLLMKSSAGATETTASSRLIESATSVIDSFTNEQVSLTKSQAESIQSLAESVGVDLKLAAKDEDDEEDDEEDDDKKVSAKGEKDKVEKSGEQASIIDVSDIEAVLKSMIGPMLQEEFKKFVGGEIESKKADTEVETDEEVKKSADDEDDDGGGVEKVTSNRIKGQDTFKKSKSDPEMDEGLFEDVIFG